MTLSVSGIAFFMLVVLAITAVGYLLGRIIAKCSLKTASLKDALHLLRNGKKHELFRHKSAIF